MKKGKRLMSLLLSFAVSMSAVTGSFTAYADETGIPDDNGEVIADAAAETEQPEDVQPEEQKDDISEKNDITEAEDDRFYVYIDGIRLPVGDIETVCEDVPDDEAERIASVVSKEKMDSWSESTEEDVSRDSAAGNTYSSSYLLDNVFTSSAERAFYNKLDSICRPILTSTLNYAGTVTYSSGKTYKLISTVNYSGLSLDRAKAIFRAFKYSNPQYYFLSTHYGQNSSEMNLYIEFLNCFGYDYSLYSQRRTAQAAIDKLRNEWMRDIDAIDGELEKELEISSKVIEYLEYDHAAVDKSNPDHSENNTFDQSLISGVLRRTTVCAGYAFLTAYFCNAAGLDCFCVTSDNHQWNIVKIYDNWYELDNTWADQSTWISEKWRNKKHATFAANDSSGAHDYEYLWDNIALPKTYYDQVQVPVSGIVPEVFADPLFRSYIFEKFDTNGDEILSSGEISGIKDIVVSGLGISDLAGIEYLTAAETLDCSNNNISELDLSASAELVTLNCSGNELKALDLSKNTKLRVLDCSKNNIGTISLKLNKALEEVNVGSNLLSKFDVNNNTALKKIDCSGNQITSFSVNRNSALVYLDCSDNKITSLALLYNTSLGTLLCQGNAIKTLDTSRCTLLKKLNCSRNSLKCINVANNPALTGFICEDNTFDIGTVTGVYSVSRLSGVDMSKVSALKGAVYDAGSKSLRDFSRDLVTYDYDCGNGFSATFTLTLLRKSPSSPKATVRSGNKQNVITWNSVAAAEYYSVSLIENGAEKLLASGLTDTEYKHTGLTNGIRYTYLVKAYVNGMWSTYTASSYVYGTPSATVSVGAVSTAAGNGTVTLRWNAVKGVTGTVKYRVHYKADGESQYKIFNPNGITGTSCTVSGLVNNKKYYFIVEVCANNNWTGISGITAVTATPKGTSGTGSSSYYGTGSSSYYSTGRTTYSSGSSSYYSAGRTTYSSGSSSYYSTGSSSYYSTGGSSYYSTGGSSYYSTGSSSYYSAGRTTYSSGSSSYYSTGGSSYYSTGSSSYYSTGSSSYYSTGSSSYYSTGGSSYYSTGSSSYYSTGGSSSGRVYYSS